MFRGAQYLYISQVFTAKLRTCPSKMSDAASKSFVTTAVMPILKKILFKPLTDTTSWIHKSSGSVSSSAFYFSSEGKKLPQCRTVEGLGVNALISFHSSLLLSLLCLVRLSSANLQVRKQDDVSEKTHLYTAGIIKIDYFSKILKTKFEIWCYVLCWLQIFQFKEWLLKETKEQDLNNKSFC